MWVLITRSIFNFFLSPIKEYVNRTIQGIVVLIFFFGTIRFLYPNLPFFLVALSITNLFPKKVNEIIRLMSFSMSKIIQKQPQNVGKLKLSVY